MNASNAKPATFTTRGSVRGGCGHAHKSYTAANACADRDHNACANHGGYSDRVVIAVDANGERHPTDYEAGL